MVSYIKEGMQVKDIWKCQNTTYDKEHPDTKHGENLSVIETSKSFITSRRRNNNIYRIPIWSVIIDSMPI